MNSLWKDLLFLHGHLLHQRDLEWRTDQAPSQATDNTAQAPRPAATTPPDDCAAACA